MTDSETKALIAIAASIDASMRSIAMSEAKKADALGVISEAVKAAQEAAGEY